MPEHETPKTSLDIAAEISIHDLFKNPHGPKYNELWSIFTRSNPRAAGAVLTYVNNYTDDPKIRDAMLSVAAKLAAFSFPDSPYTPSARLNQVRQTVEQIFGDV
jgi:hypothetical protein